MASKISLIENYDYQLIAGRYPHIAVKMNALWGSRECREYLLELTIDSRGDRRGFHENDLFTIYHLIEEHDKQFPRFAQKSDNWEESGRHPLR